MIDYYPMTDEQEPPWNLNKLLNIAIIFFALILVFYYMYTIFDAMRDMLRHADEANDNRVSDKKTEKLEEEKPKAKPEKKNKEPESEPETKGEE